MLESCWARCKAFYEVKIRVFLCCSSSISSKKRSNGAILHIRMTFVLMPQNIINILHQTLSIVTLCEMGMDNGWGKGRGDGLKERERSLPQIWLAPPRQSCKLSPAEQIQNNHIFIEPYVLYQDTWFKCTQFICKTMALSSLGV
jgi:hypothetical protein